MIIVNAQFIQYITNKGPQAWWEKKPIIGILENMSWFVPEDAPDKKYFIFGSGGAESLAREFNVPVIGQLPLFEKLRNQADIGFNPFMEDGIIKDQLVMVTESLAQQISIRNDNRVEV